MKTIVSSVKGAREFYPEDMLVRSWLYQAIRKVSQQFGYQEYDGPFLEKVELYAAKSGDELVKDQSFVFPDRGGELISLRPELTPSLARMVAQRQNELTLPLHWWSFGPFWRYERPQKGRSREFFQWNIDLIGANSPEADAELAAVGAAFFKEVGLAAGEVTILVNNRRLMDQELGLIGIPVDQRPTVFKMIDRRDKMRPEDWEIYTLAHGLNQEQLEALKGLLANRNLWQKSDELVRFFAAVESLGFSDYIRFEPQIIRGLDYYTGTVFEARDRDGEFRAVLGGGRYDNLVGDVGGTPLPGIGFAMGDMVVTLVLQKYGRIPAMQASPAQVLVTVFDSERLLASMSVATDLRRSGIRVVCYPEAARLQKQLKYADKIGVRFVVILGPEEAAANQLTIKDLGTRTQVNASQSEAADVILKMLASG